MSSFWVGTTSCVLPNVRFLAEIVEGIELVLFEVNDDSNNLFSPLEVGMPWPSN